MLDPRGTAFDSGATAVGMGDAPSITIPGPGSAAFIAAAVIGYAAAIVYVAGGGTSPAELLLFIGLAGLILSGASIELRSFAERREDRADRQDDRKLRREEIELRRQELEVVRSK